MGGLTCGRETAREQYVVPSNWRPGSRQDALDRLTLEELFDGLMVVVHHGGIVNGQWCRRVAFICVVEFLPNV